MRGISKSEVKTILPYFLLIFAAFMSSAFAFAPPKLLLPEGRIDSIQQIEPYLESAVTRKEPPGLILAVIKGHETRYLKSFGTADGPQNRPITERSVYQWWSITKLFTAVAILQLAEQGRLHLDDPVAKHLPFIRFRGKVKHEQDTAITLRRLLSHSSGLKDVGMSILGWIHFDGDPHLNQTDFLKSKLDKHNKVGLAPGREGRYTNFGYLILAAVIEAVSGKSYEDYVRASILLPLGMSRTDFIYTTRMREDEVTGSHPHDLVSLFVPLYIDMDRAVREKVDGTFWFNRVYSDQKGATGLVGSTEDLITFVKAMLGHASSEGARILSPASLALMQTPVVPIAKSPAPTVKGEQFGLAWFIRREGSGEQERITLSHGGSGMGFVCMLQITRPRDVAVIALANSTYLGRTMGLDLVEKVGALNW
jgi:D-alanyl-D-alanine carboxypeptidase